MSEIKGRHLSATCGKEYIYVLTIQPGGHEIWSARVFRDNHLVCVLARGLVETELAAEDVTEHVRSQVVNHINSLG